LIRVLAISGSLRARSLNSMLLRAAVRLAPSGVAVVLDTHIGALPLFNPDLEALDPAPVAALREQIISCNAVLIASPEYAHGVSGVIKNALDWMVGNESFVGKPVALFNASPRATIAQDALREILLTMSACVVPEACVALPILGSGLSEAGIVGHAQIGSLIKSALSALERAILSREALL